MDQRTGIQATRIDLADCPDFDLGGLRVSPARRQVSKGDQRRELEPKVAQVLVALADARSEVVSRDRLIQLCWDGRVVGDDALNRCIVALRHLAREFTPEPFSIETVPRVGYCLAEHVPGESADKGSAPPRATLVLLSILFLALAAAVAIFLTRGETAEAPPASIAVLPFRTLSPGDTYFAEGVGEEILSQLSREPQFRVAGSFSSAELAGKTDVAGFARQLGVDYVLEGSVRRQGTRVRVSADLVRANDGIRLWSDVYDGTLDDIFAIQQQIGSAIATALQRKLIRTPSLSGPLVTTGETYNLYLTARGLIKTRNRRVGGTAVDLLRDAIQHDPQYAPAWASLAEATALAGALEGHEQYIAALAKAEPYAAHALQLAPKLAEAHRIAGKIAGYGSARNIAHLRRAAQIAPNDAENMVGLGSAEGALGNFAKELAAFRRAHQLDPHWHRTLGLLALTEAEMGDRGKAESRARGLRNDEMRQHVLLGRIAWVFGDFSEAARQWSIVAQANSPRWTVPAQRSLNDAAYAAGLFTGRLEAVPRPLDERHLWRVWMDAAPSPAVWKNRNRSRLAAEVYRDENHVAAKLMLNAGRAAELAATFDSATGLLGVRRGTALRVDQLGAAPVAILALLQAGRPAEADRLLREAYAALRTVQRRGAVPFWFDAETAGLLAIAGRQDEALNSLRRAMDRGWTHNGAADLGDFMAEPALKSLHGDRRFEQLRARIAAHYARERSEMLRLRL